MLLPQLAELSSMAPSARARYLWHLRTRTLPLGQSTLLMGIVNVTPDSFSDGGQFRSPQDAITHALRLLKEGAAILDIGGESTRPGSYPRVSAAEEASRVLPVIEGVLNAHPNAIVSIDTYKAATARAAVSVGAEIVNDVSGGLWDDAMLPTCADLKCGLVLTHTRGRSAEWRNLPRLANHEVVPLVFRDLRGRVDAALSAGVQPEQIVLDPGFGFGKSFGENYPLIAGFSTLAELGYPLLAGASRKGFLGRTLAPLHAGENAPSQARLYATLAADTALALNGAHILRVHDVRPTVEAAAIADAIRAAQTI